MRFSPLAIAVAAVAFLNSCATYTPLAIDRDAKAPKLEGYGHSDVAITARSPEARALFNDGLLQAYAFNETEAVRYFKAALAKDPDCAMCAWGVAWQLGPNINATGRDNVAEAVRYVDYALKHLDGATPRERALVESLAIRYAHESKLRETAPLTGERCATKDADDGKVHPLDEAYAGELRKIAAQYPDDADILSLQAEAEIIAAPDPAPWDKKGKPSGHLGEVADRLEKLLVKFPNHTGLNHYMVHVLDASSVAARAVPAADRLGALAPASPHLLHMPAHTYINVGRFEDAVRVNVASLAADAALAKTEEAQGFKLSKDWRGHDAHFLWYAAVMAGDEKAALDATAAIAEIAKDWDNTFGEYARSLRLLTLVRFERWDAVLAEPKAAGDKGLAQAWWLFSRGVAQSHTGHAAEANALLDQLKPVAASKREKFAKRKRIVAMMDYAQNHLESEIALARGDLDGAIATQSKAADAAQVLDDNEPPMMGDAARVALGDLQARAKKWADAEATYKRALGDRPQHPLALRGLREALAAQGRKA